MERKKQRGHLRFAFCMLAAGLAALSLIAVMSLLPQSSCPVWLPLLGGLACGGLTAWFCFAPRAIRKERGFPLWGARLGAVACGALLLALCAELLVFNYRSFVTRGCEPEEMSLADFTNFNDESVELNENEEIPLTPDDAGLCMFQAQELSGWTTAVSVRLEGDRQPISFSVWLRDEASLYAYVEANNGVCVPGAEELDVWYGYLYSNGEINALDLEFMIPDGADVTLTAVTLNPQIPVSWQWFRMLGVFLVLTALGCALRFPWRQVVYQPGKRSHRWVIVLPMLGLMAFVLTMSVWCMPKSDKPFRGLWNGLTVEDAVENQDDGYAQLWNAFHHGQLSLLIEPDDGLDMVSNPYDRTQRAQEGVTVPLDYAYYGGSYYLYFGPGPVLLVYFPHFWLTGRLPSQILCGAILALLAIPLCYYAVLGIVRRFTRKQNLFLLSLCCMAVTCAAGWPLLSAAASRYENVMAYNLAMMAGVLGFGYHAVMQKQSRKRVCLFLLCGICFGLQSMGRANTLLISTAFLAPAFIGVLRAKESSWRQKLRDSALFLLPAMVGVGAVMGYNYARFGSVGEFGQLYQLTMEDISYNCFRLEQIPQALWHYLLDLPDFMGSFPYVAAKPRFLNVTGNYFWAKEGVGALTYPLLWFLLLLPMALRTYRTESLAMRAERSTTLLLPLLLCGVLMVVTYFYAGIMQRYNHDFLLALSLIATVAATSLCADPVRLEAPEGRALSFMLVVCCCLTILVSVAFGFTNERMYVKLQSPEVYTALSRMLYPY
ncbi:MAG: hypothetical protein PHI98_00905 [Eubacteriales bacterium]|nr:hypothetical protein [Eubacteriales bacterium]